MVRKGNFHTLSQIHFCDTRWPMPELSKELCILRGGGLRHRDGSQGWETKHLIEDAGVTSPGGWKRSNWKFQSLSLRRE